MLLHTFHLYEKKNITPRYEATGIVTINMAQMQTMQMVNLPVVEDLGGGTLCLLKITLVTHTIVCEPQDYESFHKMIDSISSDI